MRKIESNSWIYIYPLYEIKRMSIILALHWATRVRENPNTTLGFFKDTLFCSFLIDKCSHIQDINITIVHSNEFQKIAHCIETAWFLYLHFAFLEAMRWVVSLTFLYSLIHHNKLIKKACLSLFFVPNGLKCTKKICYNIC